jgi:hypothetical protein
MDTDAINSKFKTIKLIMIIADIIATIIIIDSRLRGNDSQLSNVKCQMSFLTFSFCVFGFSFFAFTLPPAFSIDSFAFLEIKQSSM